MRSTKSLAGGHVGTRPVVVRVPHSVVAGIANGDVESRGREAKGRVIFGAGADRSPVSAAGTGCSPAANGTPEELRRTGRPCVLSIAYRSGSTMIYRNVRQNSGCLRSNVYEHNRDVPPWSRMNYSGIGDGVV